MRKIIVADNIGFCPGVRRAVDMAHTVRTQKNHEIFTFGEIIHNGEVVSELESCGIHAISDISSLKSGETLLIRSHGAAPEVYRECEERGISLEDATCVFVKRIHGIVSEYTRKGMPVIVIGASDHPEVLGILGYCGEERFVVKSEEDVLKLPELQSALVVSQTTFESDMFDKLSEMIKSRISNVIIQKTICDTTKKRQEEAAHLSSQCDAMIVIGGKSSSNTRKLLKICDENCKNSIYIEKASDLVLDNLKSYDIIGVVAGASTPDRMIREVITRMNELVTTAMNDEQEITAAVNETAAQAAQETEPQSAGSSEKKAEKKERKAPQAHEDDEDQDMMDDSSDKLPVSAADIGDRSFEEAIEQTMVRIRGGQILSGRVVLITDDEVCVNVGYKSDGIIPLDEISNDPGVKPSDLFKVGDIIKVEVLKVNDGQGNVLLSRKNVENKEKMNAMLKDDDITEKIFDAVGKTAIRGGLIADVNGMEAFIPASLIAPRYVENIRDYVGKPLKVKIIEVDKRRKRLVASAKAAALELEAAQSREAREKLEVGSTVKGTVRSVTDFGAFLDVGGVEGLLHVTNMSWGRGTKPEELLKVGQELDVMVLAVDLERERVSLGLKQLQPKPWTQAAEKYPVGSIVTGKVVRLVSFGAFVALEPTIDGLIHISEVAERRIDKVEDALHLDDEVRCKVLDVDVQAKRISLSRKAVILEENPELVEQLEREREERERERQERLAKQREAEKNRAERAAAKSEQVVRGNSDRPQKERAPRADRADRAERGERRPRREDGDYKLPPVEQATTSLAGLFSGLGLVVEDNASEAPQTTETTEE